MSLKAFHLVFVSLSLLMAMTVGAWGLHEFTHHGDRGALILSVLCFTLAPALMVYGVKVARKFRQLEGGR